VVPYFYADNNQPIAAGQFNTKWFARTDLHWTDFITVPKTDIIKMVDPAIKKGFKKAQVPALTGKYRNGASVTDCPFQGGRDNGGQYTLQDTNTYFYKGLGSANCIDFVISLGLV
jgi:hypothetical protein